MIQRFFHYLDLFPEYALAAKAAAARHAVGLLRREGVFETGKSETLDQRHGVIM